MLKIQKLGGFRKVCYHFESLMLEIEAIGFVEHQIFYLMNDISFSIRLRNVKAAN